MACFTWPKGTRGAVLGILAVVGYEWLDSGLCKWIAGPEYFGNFREWVAGQASMMSYPWYAHLLEVALAGRLASALPVLVMAGEIFLGAAFVALAGWGAIRPWPRRVYPLGAAASLVGLLYAANLACYMGDVLRPAASNPFYEGVGLDVLLALIHAVLFALFLGGWRGAGARARDPRTRGEPNWQGTLLLFQCLLAYEWLDSGASKLASHRFFASHFPEWVTDHAAILSPEWFAEMVRAALASFPSPAWAEAVAAGELVLGTALLAAALGRARGRDARGAAPMGLAVSAAGVAYSLLLALYAGDAFLPLSADPFDEGVSLNLVLLLVHAALVAYYAANLRDPRARTATSTRELGRGGLRPLVRV